MKAGFYAIYCNKNKIKSSLKLSALIRLHIKNGKTFSKLGDNYLYLHIIDDNTFLFTKTNDKCLVQKINKSRASVEDIQNSLAEDESLGFPSFLFVQDNIIGFARTIYGPTTTDLRDFLTYGLGLDEAEKLTIEPLMRGTTTDDVMKMHFIGKTTVKVEAKTSFAGKILRALGSDDIEEELLDSIEIVIKPKHGRDIKKLAKKIVSNPDVQYSDIGVKAKDEAGSILTDHYLSQKGHLSAPITKTINAEIAEEMHYSYVRMKSSISSSIDRQVGIIKD
ncbi:protein rexA [Klebsiella oxytoca]|uniref:protein rexA n=1 Tax=Klebsiella oxytoca TaxID=571 RepID=UPI0032DB5045